MEPMEKRGSSDDASKLAKSAEKAVEAILPGLIPPPIRSMSMSSSASDDKAEAQAIGKSSSLEWEDRPKDDAQTFFQRYFANEQKLDEGVQAAHDGTAVAWYVKYRRLISFAIPITIVYLCYFPYMIATDKWHLFGGTTGSLDCPRWNLSITMIFGSMVAGATSEGGAAVAFPVLTLAMGTLPSVARDFSYLIQSVGMTAAAFSIFWMRVKLEWMSIIYCSIGGAAGLILGLEEIAPRLTPPYSKMYFVSIWFAFAVSLYWVNYFYGGIVFDNIPHWEKGVLWEKTLVEDTGIKQMPKLKVEINWKVLALLATGFLGGIFSSMSGSGLDICSFATLCLLFRVNERVATPTSVVLMAGNTLVASLYREFKMMAVSAEAYNLWLVCIPIVVIGAPIGAILSSHFHRTVFAVLIYIVDLVQFIGALVIIQPWLTKAEGGKTNTPEHLTGSSAGILIAGVLMFTLLAFFGQMVLHLENDIETTEDNISKLVSKGTDGPVPTEDPAIEKTLVKSLDSPVDDEAAPLNTV